MDGGLLFGRVLQAVVEHENGGKFKENFDTLNKERNDETG